MSRYLLCDHHHVAVDLEGYLRRLEDWTPPVAEALAEDCGLILTPGHWEIILLVRAAYQENQLALPMRPLVNLVREKLGPEKGRSIYLMRLFPGSPAKLVNRIAGLPKPSNCL